MMTLGVARKGSSQWRTAARIAQTSYRLEYGAQIDPAPDAFAVFTEDTAARGAGAPSGAVAGMTFAGGTQLLSEHYLGDVAETVLASHLGEQLERSEIVEVGALASTTRGAGAQLISLLPVLAWCNGAKAAICTVTYRLSLMLPRVGVEFVPLCPANEGDLPEHLRGQWGSYYAARPVTGYIDNRHIASRMMGSRWSDVPTGADAVA